MAKIMYQHINRNHGYYELTIKETAKSIIVIERTNHTGGYDKEIRYSKTDEILRDVEHLKKSDDTPWFAFKYAATTENASYWQSWRRVL